MKHIFSSENIITLLPPRCPSTSDILHLRTGTMGAIQNGSLCLQGRLKKLPTACTGLLCINNELFLRMVAQEGPNFSRIFSYLARILTQNVKNRVILNFLSPQFSRHCTAHFKVKTTEKKSTYFIPFSKSNKGRQ